MTDGVTFSPPSVHVCRERHSAPGRLRLPQRSIMGQHDPPHHCVVQLSSRWVTLSFCTPFVLEQSCVRCFYAYCLLLNQCQLGKKFLLFVSNAFPKVTQVCFKTHSRQGNTVMFITAIQTDVALLLLLVK